MESSERQCKRNQARKAKEEESKGRTRERNGRGRATEGREKKEEHQEMEDEEDNRSKKISREVENLGWGGRNNEIGGEGKEVGTKMISQVNQGLQKESRWKNTDEKDMGPCNRSKGRVHIKKGGNLSLVLRSDRGSEGVYSGADKK